MNWVLFSLPKFSFPLPPSQSQPPSPFFFFHWCNLSLLKRKLCNFEHAIRSEMVATSKGNNGNMCGCFSKASTCSLECGTLTNACIFLDFFLISAFKNSPLNPHVINRSQDKVLANCISLIVIYILWLVPESPSSQQTFMSLRHAQVGGTAPTAFQATMQDYSEEVSAKHHCIHQHLFPSLSHQKQKIPPSMGQNWWTWLASGQLISTEVA